MTKPKRRTAKPVVKPRHVEIPEDVRRELRDYQRSVRPGHAQRRTIAEAFPSVLERYVAREHRAIVGALGAQCARPAHFICPCCGQLFICSPRAFIRPANETLALCARCRLCGNPARALPNVAPHLARDWDEDTNGRPAGDVSADDTRSYSWIHRAGCGRRYRTSPKRRLSGAGCPHCNPQRSMLECLLLTDLAALGVPVVGQHRFHPTRRWRMDIWAPVSGGPTFGIEVDGRHWHDPDEADDVLINAWCAENGVTLIRVRDHQLGALPGAHCTYVYFDPSESTVSVSRRLAVALAVELSTAPGAEQLRVRLQEFAETAQAHLDRPRASELLADLITPGPGHPSIEVRNPAVGAAWDRCLALNHGRRASDVRANTKRIIGYYWCGVEGHPPLIQTPLRATRWQRGVPCPVCRPRFKDAYPGRFREVMRALDEGLIPGLTETELTKVIHTSGRRVRARCGACGAVYPPLTEGPAEIREWTQRQRRTCACGHDPDGAQK
jgi:hypothetical protein